MPIPPKGGSTWPEVKLYDEIIYAVNASKYLGLIIDSELTFEYHFNSILERAAKARTMLTHALRYHGVYWRKKAMFQVIDPKINYAIAAWYCNIKNDN